MSKYEFWYFREKKSPGYNPNFGGQINKAEKRIQDFKILNEKVEQYFNEKPEPKLQNPSEGSIPLYFNLPTLLQVIYNSHYGNGAPAMFTS